MYLTGGNISHIAEAINDSLGIYGDDRHVVWYQIYEWTMQHPVC